MSRPTEEEKKAIVQLRNRLGDVLLTDEHRSDPFLLRWLRARDLNLDRAEEMIRNSFQWREDNNIDKVLSRGPDPWMKANYPFKITGPDHKGHPVVIFPMGLWDMRKAINNNDEQKLLEYGNLYLETVMESIRQVNEGLGVGDYPITQVTLIADWKNYSYSQLIHSKALQNLLRLAAAYEAHYPEVMFRGIFVNCPAIFSLLMPVLSRVLAPKTLQKISCHSNPDEWKPLLLEFVPENQIPPWLGGTLVENDAHIQISRPQFS